jgi:hypothetical protein
MMEKRKYLLSKPQLPAHSIVAAPTALPWFTTTIIAVGGELII